jgi:hypothetical protein
VRAGLVTLCLAWGALVTLMVVQHASAAHDVAARETATAWFAVNQRAQQLGTAADYCAETQLEIGNEMTDKPNVRAVRFELERSYRALAQLTPDEARRVELVDMADAIRPRTLT